MPSIFTKIIEGEIPCYKVAENDRFFAFLDIQPLQKGHTLVVPKKEVDEFFDLEDELMAEMLIFAKGIAAKIKANFDCNRVGMTVIGLEVPHAHIHLIPINQEPDMNFHSPRLEVSEEEMKAIAKKLSI